MDSSVVGQAISLGGLNSEEFKQLDFTIIEIFFQQFKVLKRILVQKDCLLQYIYA